MNGISIYKARLAMGEALARQVKSELGEKMDIDVVIPVFCCGLRRRFLFILR